MRVKVPVLLCPSLAAVVLLMSCPFPSLSTKGSLTGAASAGHFLYASNFSDNSVSAYRIAPATGLLTQVSSVLAGQNPSGLAVHPAGKFLYVANGGDATGGNVSAYSIDSRTGALTEIGGSPFPAGSYPYNVKVDPTGRFLYVVNWGPFTNGVPGRGSVSAYSIDSSTGALTSIVGSPFAAGVQAADIAIHPGGNFLYAVNETDRTVSAYSVNPNTGALAEISGSPFAAGSDYPDGITIEPTGRFLYLSNWGAGVNSVGGVSVFTINSATGALAAISGSPFMAGAGASSFGVAADSSGKFLFVANNDNNVHTPSVSAYTINSSNGGITAVSGSPFTTGLDPWGITVDPTGTFVYVGSYSTATWVWDTMNGGGYYEYSSALGIYKIDSVTGGITPAGTAPAGTDPLYVTTAVIEAP